MEELLRWMEYIEVVHQERKVLHLLKVYPDNRTLCCFG